MATHRDFRISPKIFKNGNTKGIYPPVNYNTTMDNRHLQDGNYIHIVDSHVEFTRGYNQQQKWS